MAVRKKGLGKGLDSLIPDHKPGKTNQTEAVLKSLENSDVQMESQSGEQMININKVEPNREQPRKKFEEDALMELSDSIKQFGVLQPLLVRKRKDYYEIIAGERRWRAAKMAGIKEIPVIIKDYTEQEIIEIGLIENIQRENLNPIEEAAAYKRLLEEFNLKQDEVAERVSKSRTAVTNSMRLLKLCDKVQQMVIDDMISTGHARALLAIEDAEAQHELAVRIFDEKLSVRDIEKIVIEEGITTVGRWAFYFCMNLVSVEIPGSLTSIGSGAFYGCVSLADINLPDSVITIESGAFTDCSNLKNAVPLARGVCDGGLKWELNQENVLTISGEGLMPDWDSFATPWYSLWSDIKKVIIKPGVTNIGKRAFFGCTNLESAEIPGSVTDIGEAAFQRCDNLKNVEMADGVANIGSYAFSVCKNLEKIKLPENVKIRFYSSLLHA